MVIEMREIMHCHSAPDIDRETFGRLHKIAYYTPGSLHQSIWLPSPRTQRLGPKMRRCGGPERPTNIGYRADVDVDRRTSPRLRGSAY